MEQQTAPSARRELKDKSLPELMVDLSRDVSDLVNAEIAKAKAEIGEKANLAGQGAGLISGAIFALLMALATGTALAIIALSIVVEPWLAALIVTALWLLSAAVLALTGRGRIRQVSSPKPKMRAKVIKEGAK